MFSSSTKLFVSFNDTSIIDKGQFNLYSTFLCAYYTVPTLLTNLYLVIITKAVSFPPSITKYKHSYTIIPFKYYRYRSSKCSKLTGKQGQ